MGYNLRGLGRRAQITRHRARGSCGQESVGNVFKGSKMAGRHGPDPRTINAKIFRICAMRNLIFLKATIPGRKGTLIKISDARGKTLLKNGHIRVPFPTFVPDERIRYPSEITQAPMLRD